MNFPLFGERLKTDITSWEVGPYHLALPAPMKLSLKLDGEVIVSGEVETGFLHRGLEKCFERHSWRSALPYADRLDPEAAVFGELVYCLAVEEIANILIPPRAQAIRVILSELTRISGHLGSAIRVARAVGAEKIQHYILRDREKITDLFELLTGARFSLNFLRIGGVRANVTDGFIERVLDICDLVRIRLKEYNDLFTFNHAFLKRTMNVGVLSPKMVRKYGITGPSARASGLMMDARKDRPYCGYEILDFEVPLGQGEGGTLGDAHERFLIRLREVSQSIEILRQVTEGLPSGEYISQTDELMVPEGEAYVRVESSRGLLGCHLISLGGASPHRVQFRTPSGFHLLSIPELVVGLKLEDLSVVLASLDLSIAEADR
ncbi:hypothetical protein WDW86_20010 [Bdellovibrionota bacterium FG-2]